MVKKCVRGSFGQFFSSFVSLGFTQSSGVRTLTLESRNDCYVLHKICNF